MNKEVHYIYVLTKIWSETGLVSVRVFNTLAEATLVMLKEYAYEKYESDDYITFEHTDWMAQAYSEDGEGWDWNITKVKLPETTD